MTFDTLCRLYVENATARLKPTTVNNQKDLIKNHIIPNFGDCRVGDITVASVLGMSVALHGLPPSPQSIVEATQRAAVAATTAARSTPAQRMLAQMVRDTSFRSGISTSLPYKPVVFPLQEPLATLSLDEIKRQRKNYTP